MVSSIFVVVVGLLGLSAYRSALRAKTSLEAARTVISNDLSNKQVFLSPAGRAKLAADIKTVEADADNASAILQGSLGMRVFRYVPYVNDQPNGIVNLVDDVRTTAVTGSLLLQRVNTLVAQSNGTTVSLSALQSLQRSVADATTTMSSMNRSAGGLIGPIGTARRDFDQQIEKITNDLRRGDQTLSYALPFLGADGARTYLIAGENNAEMRDQGDVLSLALMHAQKGTFNVDTVGSVDDIEPSQAVNVTMPAGTDAVFGGYQPTSLWQSVNATADFPLSGSIMQAMFAQVEEGARRRRHRARRPGAREPAHPDGSRVSSWHRRSHIGPERRHGDLARSVLGVPAGVGTGAKAGEHRGGGRSHRQADEI